MARLQMENQLAIPGDGGRSPIMLMTPLSADQLVSIIQKARQAPESLTTGDLDQFAAAYRLTMRDDEPTLSDEYASLTGNDLQQDLAEAVSEGPPHPTHGLVDLMLVTLEQDPAFYEAAHAVLNLTIAKSSRKIRADELNVGQIQVLHSIAAVDRIWEYDMTLKDRLADRGLPTSRQTLRRMLATVAD